MSVLSLQSRQKAFDISMAVLVVISAWLLQSILLNQFKFQSAVCNLPLTVTILWGFVFGPSMPPISSDELRAKSLTWIFMRQVFNGSVAGFLVGGAFAALYASQSPIFPVSYPMIGWIAGYFCLRNINQETLLCIPVVLLATVLAEILTAGQLHLSGRAYVFEHLSQFILQEALLNALIAPFVYFPLRSFLDFSRT